MNDRPGTGTILHLVLSDEVRVWRDCRACCSAQDAVLLLDAGVMLLASAGLEELAERPCRLLVSEPDARARGVPEGMAGAQIEQASDADVVTLVAAHRHCLSWR